MAPSTQLPNEDNCSVYPIQGGCTCGRIRYSLNKRPLVVHCCHCTSCQRETGTAFAVNIVVEASNVTTLPPTSATVPASPTDPDNFLPANPPLAPTSTASDPYAGSANKSVQPDLILTPSESGRGQAIARCPTCRVAVWSEYSSAGPLVKYIRCGTLDRAWLIEPDLHIFTKSRRTFFSLSDAKPQFDEYYDREKYWREDSLARWDALLPDVLKYRETLASSK